jgi:hypothetical protein
MYKQEGDAGWRPFFLFAGFAVVTRQYKPDGCAYTHTYGQVMHCKTNTHAHSKAGGIK